MKTPLYLVTLKLQNFATFRQREIHFGLGLNAIVGETGSGKSLILDALQIVFGGRSDKKAVRLGAESAVVEAVLRFEDSGVARALEEMGFPSEEGEVVIKRMIRKDGTSKCWLNHMACSLQQLGQFSRRWIDLVGQFENQKLLSDAYQLRLLDQYGQSSALAEDMRERLADFRRLRDERDSLERSKTEREQRLDYVDFQMQEIDALAPREGEEDELVERKGEFLNHEKRQIVMHQLDELVEGGENGGGLAGIVRSGRALVSKNTGLIPATFADKLSALEHVYEELRDGLKGLNAREMNAEEMQLVVERLDAYQRLKRKFGGTTEAMISTREAFQKEADKIRAYEHDLSEILKQLSHAETTVSRLADELHAIRAKASVKFSKELTLAVRALRMDGADIRLELEKASELNEQGFTRLTFLAQTNPGEGFFKVKEIASGGELSRILLALRQVLSHHDSISIFLFDEIDAGMGGETALHIGKALQKVAESSQVITITHLPQIAACADRLIMVSKNTSKEAGSERTESEVREVEGKAAIRKASEALIPLH
jgi:DNA repair protein RecN (Recombination protein N)